MHQSIFECLICFRIGFHSLFGHISIDRTDFRSPLRNIEEQDMAGTTESRDSQAMLVIQLPRDTNMHTVNQQMSP